MKIIMHKYEEKIWFFMFGYLLIDSLGTYFFWNKVGFPHNSLLVIMFVVVFLGWGFMKSIPHRKEILSIALIIFGFLLGIVLNDDMGISKLFKLATALMAFVVGYTACRWTSDSDRFLKLFLSVGSLYVITCIMALLQLYPSLFPIVYSTGFRASGQLVTRPEITIDQNFQVFYLFFIPSVFMLDFKILRYTFACLLTFLGLYVLIALQTRSGLLIFLGVLMIVWVAAPTVNRKYGRYKLILLPIVTAVVFVVFYDKILSISEPLLERFQSKEVKTLEGRMFSATYLFKYLLNPLYWLPQGNEEFVNKMGDVPHFNPTAMYLEGGMFALIGWFMLFVTPLVKMGLLFIKNKLDLLASLIMVCGIASMMAQLSLNAPLYDHVWLWGGAVIGSLDRIRLYKPSNDALLERKSPKTNKVSSKLTYIHLK